MRRKRYAALALAGTLMMSGMFCACGEGPVANVISVAELNSGYYGGTVSLNGYVTDEASQNVYLKSSAYLPKQAPHIVFFSFHILLPQYSVPYQNTSLCPG